MKTTFLAAQALLWIILLSAQIAFAEKVLIAANDRIATNFARWTADTPCTEIDNFSNPNASRGTVDLILICQALDATDYKAEITIVNVPNYLRALALTIDGKVDMAAESIWRLEIRESSLYFSPPIIREGEFEKGIYTSPHNKKVLGVSSLEELRQLTAVIPSVWFQDKEALKEMGVSIVYVPLKQSIYKMVASRRADFTLLEFSNSPDLSKVYNDVRLIPVKNIKIALKGSRHFVVSKAARDSSRLHEALTIGVNRLRQQGRIRRAYQQSGFISNTVKDWNRIY